MTWTFLYLQNPEPLVTTYFLPLVFGFIILPEETPFAHPVDVETSLQDVGKIAFAFDFIFIMMAFVFHN